MAGGNTPKASSSSSNCNSGNNPSADKKPSGARDSKPSSNPNKENHTPKPGANPSPRHPKLPMDSTPRSVPRPAPPGAPFPFPDSFGPPPPTSGFHMLERRPIVLADGSAKSYFSLPTDYHEFTPPPAVLPHGPGLGFENRFPPLGPMSPEFRERDEQNTRDRNREYWNSLKRRYGDEGGERQQLLQYGNVGLNPNGYYHVGSNERGDGMRAAKYMRIGGGGDYENIIMHGSRQEAGVCFESGGLKHNDVDQGALKKAFLYFVKLINENVSQKKNYLENGK